MWEAATMQSKGETKEKIELGVKRLQSENEKGRKWGGVPLKYTYSLINMLL